MERDDHRQKAQLFIAATEGGYPENLDHALSNALYTFSELGLWKMDIDIKEAEVAIRVWAVVESVRRAGAFPEELCM